MLSSGEFPSQALRREKDEASKAIHGRLYPHPCWRKPLVLVSISHPSEGPSSMELSTARIKNFRVRQLCNALVEQEGIENLRRWQSCFIEKWCINGPASKDIDAGVKQNNCIESSRPRTPQKCLPVPNLTTSHIYIFFNFVFCFCWRGREVGLRHTKVSEAR